MKVGIVGGAGRVGSTVCYTLVLMRQADEVYLLDRDSRRAEGEAMDVMHTLSAVGSDAEVRGGSEYGELEGSDLVIVTAGAPRKPGMSRLELRGINREIVGEIAAKVAEHAPESMLFIVTNPVDVLTYHAWKASGFPRERVFGLGTYLDTVRLRSILRKELGVGYGEEAYIFGEHGDSMFPVFRLSREYPEGRLMQVYEEVRTSAMKVISSKGGTWFAPALAIAKVVEALARGGRCTLSTYLEEHGLYLGYLAEVSMRGVRRAEFELTEEERRMLQRSAEVVGRAIEG